MKHIPVGRSTDWTSEFRKLPNRAGMYFAAKGVLSTH